MEERPPQRADEPSAPRPKPPEQRPEWWPDGVTWPPRARRPRHPQVSPQFWPCGCFFALTFFVLLNVGIGTVAWLVARAFGVVDVPAERVILSVGIAFTLLIVVVAGLVAIVRTMGRAAAPLRELMTATERVADGDVDVRVRPRGPREVRRVIDAFNTMAERLGRAEKQRVQLLADVGHELRTPLSVIQGQLEGTLDGVYERDDAQLTAILEETRHMSRIVEDLRMLSLAESGALRLDRRPTSLDEIVDDAIDAHAPPAAVAGVSVTSTVPLELPPVDADPTRLREVLDNVLTNAIRYTPPGGSVTVGAHRYGPSHIRVHVTDTGRGIPGEQLTSVFERFHRSPDSRGSGLGLAIARDLVRAHGGEMDAESDGPGLGTRIRFTLPIALEK